MPTEMLLTWLPYFGLIAVILFGQWYAIKQGHLTVATVSRKKRLLWAIIISAIIGLSYFDNGNVLNIALSVAAGYYIYFHKTFYSFNTRE